MHKSVLKDESIKYLALKEDDVVVDMTLGYAGHSSEILKRINGGFLFAFDQDEIAISSSYTKLSAISNNFKIIKSNFVHLKKELNNENIFEVDKVLFDLGVSSPQLDVSDRGFSFHGDARIDMRMDQSNELDAHFVVNNYSYDKLVEIFYNYGEEKFAKSIAKNIVLKREEKVIKTTSDLVEIIKESVPFKYKREKHPARKVFQAIRIEVNDELNVFEKALRDSISMLSVGGRICVITFHSLEDKICKNIFNEFSKEDEILKNMPVVPEKLKPNYKVIKTVKPSKEEIKNNPRARSSKLRVIERVKR